MREVPEAPLRAWEPPDYRVDALGKIEGVAPPEIGNWGRWGDEDQRGTANLFTPERVAAAAALIRTGRRFSLAIPIGGGPGPGYRPAPLHLFERTTGDTVLGEPGLQWSDDYLMIALQATTQLDGLAHFGADRLLYNGYWAGVVTAGSGARRLGIHHQADGIVGRAVLLDVARHLGLDRLVGAFPIDADLLEATAAAQDVEVSAGDIVLVRTGHLGWWYSLEDKTEFGRDSPGLSPRAIPWMAERDVAMVATDTLALEVIPPEEGERPLAFHIGALRDLGLLLGEMFDLDDLAEDCAADGVYECFLLAAPLPVVNGVGSPLNPIAIK